MAELVELISTDPRSWQQSTVQFQSAGWLCSHVASLQTCFPAIHLFYFPLWLSETQRPHLYKQITLEPQHQHIASHSHLHWRFAKSHFTGLSVIRTLSMVMRSNQFCILGVSVDSYIHSQPRRCSLNASFWHNVSQPDCSIFLCL